MLYVHLSKNPLRNVNSEPNRLVVASMPLSCKTHSRKNGSNASVGGGLREPWVGDKVGVWLALDGFDLPLSRSLYQLMSRALKRI
jgi:hypothetical protein